jgi:hypothetical protein
MRKLLSLIVAFVEPRSLLLRAKVWFEANLADQSLFTKCALFGLLLFTISASNTRLAAQKAPTPAVQPNMPSDSRDATRINLQTLRSPNNNSDPPTYPRERHFLSDREAWLSFEVLLFGAGVIIIEFLLLRRHPVSAEEALRVYAITLIIVGALFTVTAGFDNISVAPAFGLLGTVAGYLLGRKPSSESGEQSARNLAAEKDA